MFMYIETLYVYYPDETTVSPLPKFFDIRKGDIIKKSGKTYIVTQRIIDLENLSIKLYASETVAI